METIIGRRDPATERGEGTMRKSIQRQGPMLAALMAVLSLAGCARLEIADHAVDYNKTVEEARNSLLLLNILRAKDRLPMHFTAFSQLRGSLTLKSTGSLSLQIPFGGDASNTFPLTPSLELSQTSSPSFDVAILGSKEFMSGILSPIEKSTLKFYLDQRWPSEVLLHLFIHKVTVTYKPWEKNTTYPEGWKILANGLIWTSPAATSGNTSGKTEPKWGADAGNTVQDNGFTWTAYAQTEIVNAPNSEQPEGFENFQKWIAKFRKKLRFGTSKSGRPIGADLELKGQAVLEHLVEAEKAELSLVKIPEKPRYYRLCKITTSVILCFGECPKSDPKKDCRDGTDEESATLDDRTVKVAKVAKVAGKPEQPEQTAHLRSVQGILYYLGEVLRYKEDSNKDVIIDEAIGKPKKLFDLTTKKEDVDPDTPVISVDYNNRTWYVPTKDKKDGRTKTVLALVLQLLGLHKESKELPTTTAVETVGGSP